MAIPLLVYTVRNCGKEHTAIEVKATKKPGMRETKGLVALAEEKHFKSLLLVSHDPVNKKQGGIQFLHWRTFIERLWSDDLF